MNGQARTPETRLMDEAVRRYRDEMDSRYRPVFDRLHQLIAATCPDAEVVLSYGMPTYHIGRRRLNIGAWKHGLSLYVSPNRDGGFSARHPDLAAGKGTIRLRPGDAACIPDAEFQDLIRAALLAYARRDKTAGQPDSADGPHARTPLPDDHRRSPASGLRRRSLPPFCVPVMLEPESSAPPVSDHYERSRTDARYALAMAGREFPGVNWLTKGGVVAAVGEDRRPRATGQRSLEGSISASPPPTGRDSISFIGKGVQ